ncbi:MAG: succinate dehydrogenase/fumarate reductase iron-sulfur subunit [Bdellovibrio sp. CG10_big_fil_rev_8_21_14_0_10_47_8]|nr:MAG: succinate dehydrogenase/fumarate reductase iron-sulfur subunit [Bdellovibrio sp. CG10_big_fil_rev_8_21_14_0_10_47_8]
MGSGTGKNLNLKLKVWRQKSSKDQGHFEELDADQVSEDASFLEMLDQVNEKLVLQGKEPIVFDHDCREGICGSCGFMINGAAHGPMTETTVCQLHMRNFKDGETLVIEPWRAKAFPVMRDLMVDRSAFDRVISSGGYISVDTGNAPDANGLPIPKPDADEAFSSATCIGCGACVASCKNASAMLFVAAKVSHFALLPQGQVERNERVLNMVTQMDEEGFGSCTNTGACSASCPKGISLSNIARLNRELFVASLDQKKAAEGDGV